MRQTILRWQRKPLGEKAFIILNGLFLLIICAIILYPIIYQVYNSVFLYSAEDIRFKDISECKRKFSLRRWHEILSKEQYRTEIFTSFARTIIGTVLSLCLTTFLAFVLSRREIRWRHIMSLFWVITFYIEPGIVTKVIYYKKIGLAPSFWVYVIPGAINAIYLVVLRTYMEHLPPELDEAAIMEGAGYWKRFIKITLPQCKPIVATVALFTASAQWYSWIDTYLYNRLNEKYYTLAYRYFANFPSHLLIDAVHGRSLEYAYRNAEYSESVLFCLLSIPIVILSLFCRRYFMPDIKIGDVKS